LSEDHPVVHAIVAAFIVDPKQPGRFKKALELAPLAMPQLLPVEIGIKQPVFLLKVVGERFNKWHMDHIQNHRIAPVLILTLALGDLLMLTVAYGPNPCPRLVVNDLPARDAASAEVG